MPHWNIPQPEGENRARDIRWIVMDVDGVLTDGTIYVSDAVHETKGFNVKDGHGMRMWQRSGKHLAIITGRSSPAVSVRSADLDIQYVYQSAHNKRETLERFLNEAGARKEEICYIGDDLMDIPVMREVQLAVAVADASPEAREASHLVTGAQGGRGAVREVIDLLLKLQGSWKEVTERYYS